MGCATVYLVCMSIEERWRIPLVIEIFVSLSDC